MNKKEFIEKLEKKLSKIKKSERDEAISYYVEIIDDAIEEGKKEKEAIKELGDIDEIVNKIIDNQDSSKNIEKKPEKRNTEYNILLIVASPFIFLAFIIIMSLFIAAYSVIFSMYCVGVSLIIASIGVIIDFFCKISSNVPYAFFELGFSIFSIGFSIILVFIMNMVVVRVNKILMWIIKRFANLFKGGMKNE